MPRELPAYRDNLERICEAFPENELLDRKKVAEFLGVSEKYVSKTYPFNGRFISKATLARCLS